MTAYLTTGVTGPSFDICTAFIKFQSDCAIDGPLAGRDGACNELPLGREEVAIVQDPTKLTSGKTGSGNYCDIPKEEISRRRGGLNA